MKKLLFFILICGISFVGCNKKTPAAVEQDNEETPSVEVQKELTEATIEAVEEITVEEAKTDYVNSNYTITAGKYFGGKRLQTNILTDKAMVHALPNEKSEVLFQAQFNQVFDVINFSDTKSEVDGVSGYWVYCYASDEQGTGEKGWVHSKDINIDRLAEVSEITLAYEKSDRSIYINVLRHSGESFDLVECVYISRFPGQDFYTFVWNSDYDQAFYTDPVGTFAWYPETNEIKHISYFGSIADCGWTRASDDQKFIFEDYGTAPGIRGLGIFDVEKNKIIFSGSYYEDLELADNEVTVVKDYSEFNITSGKISEEDAELAKEFEATVPLSDSEKEMKNSGLGVNTAIQYRYNYLEDFKYYKGCIRYISQ